MAAFNPVDQRASFSFFQYWAETFSLAMGIVRFEAVQRVRPLRRKIIIGRK